MDPRRLPPGIRMAGTAWQVDTTRVGRGAAGGESRRRRKRPAVHRVQCERSRRVTARTGGRSRVAYRHGATRLRSRQTATTAVALLYILLWSSAFIATRVGVEHSPPLTLLSIRFLAAASLLAVLARARGLQGPRSGRAWGRLAVFGLLNSGLYLGFSYEAIQHMSAGMGSIIAALNPLLLTLRRRACWARDWGRSS